LETGKTKKYFKYAIGEIVLVVIGILIALQINTWNEERKDSIEERVILENLLENLKLAKQQSESLISEEIDLKKLLIYVLGIEANSVEVDTRTISDAMFKNAVWDLQSDLPTINAYDNLKNTNKLRLIKNKNISEKFNDLDFRFNKLNNVLEDRLSVHQIRIDDIFENDINFIPIVKTNVTEINISHESINNYNEILSDKRTRNLLGMKLDFTQDVLVFRENLDTEMENLIVLIASELHKN
jgi:hypothetical protein